MSILKEKPSIMTEILSAFDVLKINVLTCMKQAGAELGHGQPKPGIA